ncbi:MAG: NAD-dependent epimerase/dehydratase family protein [Bacteroidetes bacterium]|nr:NAD-dependent epimerase/dehydratase family protein [Bacteroidota bacterium]
MNLVTGATGIIGSHVVLKLLQLGVPVVAAKQKSSDIFKVQKLFSYYTPQAKELFKKIKWVDINVSDVFSIEEVLDGISTVYHCAGYVSFDRRKKTQLFKINETGTANIVNACLSKNVTLCHVSSVVTINNLDHKTDLTENVFWKTSGKESDYAISKYNAEREVWRGIEEGLKAVIVNPGVVLSPGFWNQSSSRIFSTCYKGNAFYTLGTSGLISAVDVAAIMIKLVEEKQFANRYILVEGNYTFKYLFDTIQSYFGKPKPYINATRFVLQLGRIADGIRSKITSTEPAITKSIINSSLNKQSLSNQKIVQTLNYTFEPIEAVISKICGIYITEKKNKR